MDDYRGNGLHFGNDFTFGTATAAYQIEGAAGDDGRGPSIWDTFSHTPGRVHGGDTGDVACDHYHRMAEDLDLLASYGVQAYRFSISWPRIVPTGSGLVNEAGYAFYNDLIDGLLERDIKPVVTLYHWDLPQPLEDAGGWPNRDTASRFAEFARTCGEAFGDRVDTWITLNEPMCSAMLGYGLGIHAPGRHDIAAALQAAHTLNLAHGMGIQALRSVVTNAPSMSVTNNLATVLPASDSDDDALAVRKMQAVLNRIWTGPQVMGGYPHDLFEFTKDVTDWSFVRDGDQHVISQPIDLLGLNWYTPQTVRHLDPVDGAPAPFGFSDVGLVEVDGERTDMGWLIAPEALEQQLVDMYDEFGELPLVVTENGCAYDDPVVVEDGVRRVHDERRIDYLRRHLTAVHRAIERGVPVKGYYLWSLMDNFEWAEGYSKRFGITHVDYDTLERTPKDSALWYAEVARTKSLPDAG